VNKRQRRKHHLGEFQELGFNVDASVVPMDTPVFYAWFDTLIAIFEAHNLAVGGGCSVKDGIHLAVSGVTPPRGSHGRWKSRTCTEADRESVMRHLMGLPEVAAYTVGPLVDSWHGKATAT